MVLNYEPGLRLGFDRPKTRLYLHVERGAAISTGGTTFFEVFVMRRLRPVIGAARFVKSRAGEQLKWVALDRFLLMN